MPIKSRPIDPQRALRAAKGTLSRVDEVGARVAAQREEQQRHWDEEGSHDSSSASSITSLPLATNQETSRAEVNRAERHDTEPAESAHENEEDALLAAAQRRTRAFLEAGNHTRVSQDAGPLPSSVRLAAYEAGKRRTLDGDADEVPKQAPTTLPDQRLGSSGFASSSGAELQFPEDNHRSVEHHTAPAVSVYEEAVSSLAPRGGPTGLRPKDPKTDAPATVHADPLQQDFSRLMELFADDAKRDRDTANGTQARGSTEASSRNTRASAGAAREVEAGYQPPARTFAQQQANELLQLYEAWGSSGDTGVHGSAGSSDSSERATQRPFVATEHEAAAFTLAALRSSASVADGGPLMLEDLAVAEAMKRGCQSQPIVQLAPPSGDASHDDLRRKEYAALSADGIASAAQKRLSRFLQAVTWTERLVRDPVFVRSVASFLYENHRVFLAHVGSGAAADGKGMPVLVGDLEKGDREPTVEHSHEEHAVYECFGSRVSDVLLGVLTAHVEGFSEAEYVESLFDSPDGAYEETELYSAGALPYAVPGPQNILSYPAWRIILAMSSFSSFFTWMLDYIREEYLTDAETPALGADPVLAVGGTRGLRALIKSTYHRDLSAVDHGPAQPLAPTSAEPSADGVRPREVAPALPDVEHPVLSTSAPSSPAPQKLDDLTEGEVTLKDGLHADSALPVTLEEQLSTLRENARFFASPPPSSLGPTLRPRNSHVRQSQPQQPQQRGKKPSAVAARDLPPLTGGITVPNDFLTSSPTLSMNGSTCYSAPSRPSSEPAPHAASVNAGRIPLVQKTPPPSAAPRAPSVAVKATAATARQRAGEGGRAPNAVRAPSSTRTVSKGRLAARQQPTGSVTGTKPSVKRTR